MEDHAFRLFTFLIPLLFDALYILKKKNCFILGRMFLQKNLTYTTLIILPFKIHISVFLKKLQ
jgi:hypothetical protein